jgi:lipid-A-disaccharide synthase
MTSKPREPIDVLILSNGPGEVTTWVRPVVRELRQQWGSDRALLRISVVLSPCTNAMGTEAEVVRGFEGCDHVQAAEHFWPFLLWGKTHEAWDWRPKGIVIFLGGDQVFPVVIGKRLGYKIVIYAEWEPRWPRWVDQFAVMNDTVRQKLPPQHRHKGQIVGDLMRDVDQPALVGDTDPQEWIGILPGSKPLKLTQGVPTAIALTDRLKTLRPHSRTAIPVAPTLDLTTLARYADPQFNPILTRFGSNVAATLITPPDAPPYLKTAQGNRIELWTDHPAHDRLRQCQVCITTIGANTAELAALNVPMGVIIPTQQIDAMRAWDGLPGLIAKLPGIGVAFITAFNSVMYWQYQRREQQGKKILFAWPNLWAGREIVPELVGPQADPEPLSEYVVALLNDPQRLSQMRAELQAVRGQSGAAQALVKGLASLMEPPHGHSEQA